MSAVTASVALANGRIRVLMVATDGVTSYRVLRCAHACGAEVYVLGNSGVRTLRLSRFCRRAIVSEHIIHGARDEGLALEINGWTRELGIALVVPADAPAIRAVIASKDLIEAPCFPLPKLEHFDVLNNKWSFGQLCAELGIPHPVTRLLPDPQSVARALESGALPYPLIVKPLDRSASAGVMVLESPESAVRLRAVHYRPLLVQEFIGGEDIGAAAYAQVGQVTAFVAHSLQRGVYATFRDDAILSDVSKIVRHFSLDGVYNFDMMRTPDGRVYYLECNPRPYYKIDLSMIAGVNFMERGIHPAKRGMEVFAGSRQTKVRFPKALLRSILTSGTCSRRDWALAAHLFLDPVPFFLEKLGLTV
ncbi:MAG TPA: ATP-grasp domain-containing protein [Steroidobacteraceae bacterium]|nr:ATP-grasp domain-containing protein [Steroidobacteraceae bacterium]